MRQILQNTPGVTVQDNLDTFTYPMPIYAQGKMMFLLVELEEMKANRTPSTCGLLPIT